MESLLAREALLESTRAVSESFFVQSRYREGRNTVCTREGYAASVSRLTPATAALYFPFSIPKSGRKRSAHSRRRFHQSFPKKRSAHPAVCASKESYYFSIKWLTPFYPANPSQAAGGGEKCMDLRFLRLRRWLLKQQPNKTVFNRFIEN